MDTQELLLELAGGRSLQVRAGGPRDGIPLVAHHGTPSSGLQFRPYVEAAAERGLRLVTYSRPGYARSTRAQGRSVADCTADTAAIADHFDAERFFTTGQSGGGPHALACAALLPDRVIACAATASVAPFDAPGLDWLAGMAPENIEETNLTLAGEDELLPYLDAMAAVFRDLPPEALAGGLGDLISDVDAATLGDAFGVHAKAMLTESVSTGLWGWADDDAALFKPWGFDLSTIRVPTAVWHGGQDHAVPFAHGEWLSTHVPGAKSRLFPEEGHLSLIVGRFPAILDDLLAAT